MSDISHACEQSTSLCGGYREKTISRGNSTHPEHASHTEALDLAEATERLLGDVFHKRIEGAFEQRGCCCANLSMHTDKEHQDLEYVRADL